MTVLFADLSSFTAMTGRLGAEASYSIVDDYLRLAARIVVAHGGTVDKFIGDAVMSFFNVPVKRPDHSAAAVAAAEELHNSIPGLSEKLGITLRVSIGIAAGFARVGRLGSDDPKDYSAIGDCVNQAARLQAQARAGETVVSDQVYRSVAPAYPGVMAEQLTLKGFFEPCVAHRLNGAPAAVAHDATWLDRRPAASWSAVGLALIGSGCLGKMIALTAVLSYGAGWASALTSLAVFLDHGPLRTPVLAISFATSIGLLGHLLLQYLRRKQCMAHHRCLEMTVEEKRYAQRAATLAVLAIMLITIELATHHLDAGGRRRNSIAKAVSAFLK